MDIPKSKKIHVLMLLGWYYPDSVGGTENYVRLLSRDLNSLGYKVTIFAPSKDELENSYEYEGINVYRYPVSSSPSLEEIRGESAPKYIEYFKNKIHQIAPDIVHMHSFTRGCSVFHAEVITSCNIPLILTVHVPDFICSRGTLMKWGEEVCSGEMNIEECTSCYSQMQGVSKSLSKNLNHVPEFISTAAKKIDNKVGTALSLKNIISTRISNTNNLFSISERIVAVSKWYRSMLIINGVRDEKIVYSPHGIPENQNVMNDMSQNHDSTLKIGFIGRFKLVKGVHVLIEAVKSLSAKTPVELQLYGRADTEEEIQYLKKLKDLSQNDTRINFIGELTSENRSRVFASIDILAIPSIWLETGPYVLLEAFSENTPVIGSNLGGIAELVDDGINGKLVKAGDAGKWARAIEELAQNKERIIEYRKGIGPVRRSINVAKDMAGLYENTLKSQVSLIQQR